MLNKQCQNCKSQFIVEDDDLAFYKKISVPAPTFCPQCRLQRRLSWRNERFLYSRQCDGTKKNIISCYDKDAPFPVYSREYWYSDKWDAITYGRAYDFSRPFFEQFMELMKVAPRLYMWQVNTTGSDYSNYIVDSKDCYLCFTALGGNEDCSYSSYVTNSKDCTDCHLISKCDLCYECLNCDLCHNVKHSVDSKNCQDCWFLIDCNNCTSCFGCVGLRDKQYHIFNEAYTKEEYEKRLKSFHLESRQNIPEFEAKVAKLARQLPKRYMHGYKNDKVTGDYVNDSKDLTSAFLSRGCEDGKNLYFCLSLKASQDVTVSPLGNELLYECHAIPKSNYAIKFSDLCSNGSRNLEYCDNCDASSNCFGCIGVRNKEFCILNKQYAKEEYEALVPKIRQHMMEMPYKDKAGRQYRYGEFFPIEASPFAYNESVAQEHLPLTKETAAKAQFRWKDLKPKNYQISLSPFQIPDSVQSITEDICKEVLGCQHEGNCEHNCSMGFRITSKDLQFYKRLNLSLPKLCPNCRHCERFKKRNPLKLWPGKCAKCAADFMTSYSPDKQKEFKVYCESCYQQEMV